MIELIAYLVIIILVAGFAIRGKRNHPVSASFGRKILHIVAIGLSAIAPLRFPDIEVIQIIVSIAFPIVLILVWRGFLPDPKTGVRSWGIVYFVGIYLALLFVFEDRTAIIFYAMMVLALADGFATIVGERFRPTMPLAPDIQKTLAGSITFFILAFLSLYWVPKFFLPQELLVFEIGLAVLIAIFLTALEAISLRGTDNIWVPVAVVYFLLLDKQVQIVDFAFSWLAILAAFAFIFRMKWLSASGAVAALLMAWVLIADHDGLLWLMPPFVFLVLGSLASRLPKSMAIRSDATRDSARVWANGAVGLICLAIFIISRTEAWAIAGIAAFAAALSDTISSEFGQRYGKRTFYIIGFREVPVGLSGGVSQVGLAAGVLASILMGILSVYLLPSSAWFAAFLVCICGIAGNLCDSLFGQYLQAKYRLSKDSALTDFPSSNMEKPHCGKEWITNNAVNLAGTFTAALLALVVATVF